MMFEFLQGFRRILVTGPQRSGTTIAAKMIAHDTGHVFAPEETFGINDVERWQRMVRFMHNTVLQCPSMCRYVHEFGGCDDVAVVLMVRPIGDIIRSQERIDWCCEDLELARYDNAEPPIAAVKYNYWHRHQKHLIKHAFEIPYESLSQHPLWIPAERRKHFGPRQTQ